MLEKASRKRGEDYIRRMEEGFYKTSQAVQERLAVWYQRFADNNGISLIEAKERLTHREMQELRWTVEEYIKAAKKAGLGGEHTDKKFLEKKFLGTGSPKFDKVLNTKKEALEIPEEWLKIIKKPDGTWKKIIFYNNSIGALLAQNEKMITKMESVFKNFKENREEIALLWRPHPLIESTLTAMRPQLWEVYKAIRDK